MSTWITAHAGCEGAPAASGLDIKLGIERGADAVEMDVRVRDGVPYLAHDVADGDVLTLTGALALVRDHAGILVNLDVKEDAALAPALACARDMGMGGRVLITGNLSAAAQALAARMGAWRWHNAHRDPGEPAEQTAARLAREAYPCRVININHAMLDQALFDALAARGLRVSAWTADTDADIVRLLRMGVYNLTTRRPGRCAALRSL